MRKIEHEIRMLRDDIVCMCGAKLILLSGKTDSEESIGTGKALYRDTCQECQGAVSCKENQQHKAQLRLETIYTTVGNGQSNTCMRQNIYKVIRLAADGGKYNHRHAICHRLYRFGRICHLRRF